MDAAKDNNAANQFAVDKLYDVGGICTSKKSAIFQLVLKNGKDNQSSYQWAKVN
jgi:hypothetical protein